MKSALLAVVCFALVAALLPAAGRFTGGSMAQVPDKAAQPDPRAKDAESLPELPKADPNSKVVPLNPRAERTGRGSLAGRLRLADDWDTPSVNDAIARDFGLAPQ